MSDKDILGIIGGVYLLLLIIFIVLVIGCRRGFQKYLDPHFENKGTIKLWSHNQSMGIMIRTLIYLGGSIWKRGHDFHFEGEDPREYMPNWLRWTAFGCRLIGVLHVVVLVLAMIYGHLTDQFSLWDVYKF